MSPLYYIVSLALALVLVFSAATVSETYQAVSRYETASEQVDTKLKTALEWMSFGIYEGASEKAETVAYERLASAGNLAVASLLFLFSAVIPVAKLLLSFVALSGAGDGLRRAALHTIRFIGKWSMTDVFVVAILLAFFSTESKSFTDASVGPGLYFFAGYGLLSLLGGQVLLRDSATGANGAP